MMNIEIASRALRFRGEIFSRNIPLYVLGAAIGVHPGPLGQMLLGRIPMPEGIADRIEAVLLRVKQKTKERDLEGVQR